MPQENITATFGFEILKEAENTRIRLAGSGTEALVSLAKALIRYKTSDVTEIANEMVSIAGAHQEWAIETVLMEGENVHWTKYADNTLSSHSE